MPVRRAICKPFNANKVGGRGGGDGIRSSLLKVKRCLKKRKRPQVTSDKIPGSRFKLCCFLVKQRENSTRDQESLGTFFDTKHQLSSSVFP